MRVAAKSDMSFFEAAILGLLAASTALAAPLDAPARPAQCLLRNKNCPVRVSLAGSDDPKVAFSPVSNTGSPVPSPVSPSIPVAPVSPGRPIVPFLAARAPQSVPDNGGSRSQANAAAVAQKFDEARFPPGSLIPAGPRNLTAEACGNSTSSIECLLIQMPEDCQRVKQLNYPAQVKSPYVWTSYRKTQIVNYLVEIQQTGQDNQDGAWCRGISDNIRASCNLSGRWPRTLGCESIYNPTTNPHWPSLRFRFQIISEQEVCAPDKIKNAIIVGSCSHAGLYFLNGGPYNSGTDLWGNYQGLESEVMNEDDEAADDEGEETEEDGEDDEEDEEGEEESGSSDE